MRAIHVASVIALCAASAGAGAWLRPPPPAPEAPSARAWHELVDDARPTAEAGTLRAAALEMLDTSEDPVALVESIALLGTVGVSRDAELLESFARSRDPVLAGPAVQALGRLGTDEAVDVLAALVSVPGPGRAEALGALGRSRNPRALPRLQKWLGDTELGPSAALGLADFGGPEAVTVLATAFSEATDAGLYAPVAALARLSATSPEAERLLRDVVAGPRTVRRMTVLAALAQVRDPLVFDALISDLRDAPGPIAVHAATALGVLGDPRAIPVLKARCTTGASELRYAAMGALSTIDTAESRDAMLDLAESANPSIAANAVQSLSRVDAPDTVARLVALSRHASPDVRSAIAGRLLSWPWQAGEVPPDVLALARDLLRNPPGNLPTNPIGLLLAHGDPEDWALIEQLIHEGSPLRTTAVWSLQQLASPEAQRLLHALAEDPDPTVRRPALGVLLERGETALVERVLLEQIRSGALDYGGTESMLVQIGTDQAVDAVLERIRTGTSRERNGAVNAIASGGSRAQIDRLLQLADETSDPQLEAEILSSLVYSDTADLMAVADRAAASGTPQMDGTAAMALARLGTPEARERLLDRVAGASDPMARQQALSALASLGGPDAESALIEALQDPESASAAIGGLQQVGTTAAREALVDAALGRSVAPEVRLSVLSQIAYMEGVDSDAVLGEALRDPVDGVRFTAIGALENLGTSDAAETLGRLLANPSAPEEDRRMAARALDHMGGQVADRHRDAIEVLTPGDTGP